MNRDLDGYVIYAKKLNKDLPLGIVSDIYDCKAVTEYIPTRLKTYLVEIEDKRFYTHKGLDYRGLSRAIVANIRAGRIVQGGSTISQQLARNIMRDSTKTVKRKLKEAILAVHLEGKYSKDEILNLYFNNVYFGGNIWGLRAAGIHYFNKEVENLTQVELLYLLTILRGPNYYRNSRSNANRRFKTINKKLLDGKKYQIVDIKRI